MHEHIASCSERGDSVNTTREFYLGQGDDAVHAVFHESPGTLTPVLFCPPFGWEELCSYRSIRFWADEVARAGHPALRIDLPSTGDSGGGPRAPARMEAWTDAVVAASRWLAATTDAAQVTAIGIGVGGMLACCAAQRGAPVGDLVLWGVTGRGRRALRELRAFALLKSAGSPGTAPAEEPDDTLEVGGFALAAETQEALGALDLAAFEALGRGRRVLLLGRDGMKPDAKLNDHLVRSGASVTSEPGAGWAAMMDIPQDAKPPRETIAAVGVWLGAGPDSQATLAVDAPRTTPVLELSVDGTDIRESPMSIVQDFGCLRGVLAEPASGAPPVACAVFLNAGAIRRIGPNRLWVEASRKAAARGVASLRLDVEGLGDSDGDATGYIETVALNAPELVAQVRVALDALEDRGLPPNFTLIGLCSGGYHSFQVALQDDRVSTACLINAGALFWDDSLTVARDAAKFRLLLKPSIWRRVLRGQIRPSRGLELVRAAREHRLAPVAAAESDVEAAFDVLREADRRLVFAFSGNEPLYRELSSQGVLDQLARWPNVELAELPGAVHTLRPLQAQTAVRELIQRLLVDDLAGAAPDRPVTAG